MKNLHIGGVLHMDGGPLSEGPCFICKKKIVGPVTGRSNVSYDPTTVINKVPNWGEAHNIHRSNDPQHVSGIGMLHNVNRTAI